MNMIVSRPIFREKHSETSFKIQKWKSNGEDCQKHLFSPNFRRFARANSRGWIFEIKKNYNFVAHVVKNHNMSSFNIFRSNNNWFRINL